MTRASLRVLAQALLAALFLVGGAAADVRPAAGYAAAPPTPSNQAPTEEDDTEAAKDKRHSPRELHDHPRRPTRGTKLPGVADPRPFAIFHLPTRPSDLGRSPPRRC